MEPAKHYSDEKLLAHLDGELPPGEHDAILTHLKVCWECRAKAAELERQIEALAASLAQQTFPGPECFLRAKDRLTRSLAEQEYSGSIAPSTAPRRSVSAPRWIAAGVLCATALLIFAVVPREQPAVHNQSPDVVSELRRVESVQETTPLHQVMRADVLSGTTVVRRARLEIWEEPEQKLFAARWLNDSGAVVDGIWRDSKASAAPSPVALPELVREGFEPDRVEAMFRHWLRRKEWTRVVFARDLIVLANTEGASILAERQNGVARYTATSVKGDERMTIVLEINEADQSAVTQLVRFESADKSVELRLITERREKVPRHLLNLAVFRPPVIAREHPSEAPVIPAPSAESEPITVPAAIDLSSVKVQVDYLLHDLKACIGEPLSVNAEGHEVVVRGIVMEKDRERALAAALAQLQSPVRIELQTYEEAARRVQAPRTVVAQPQFARAAHLPLEDLLARHFSQDGVRIATFTSAVIASADAAMSHAWALRRIEERYREPEFSALTAPSRRLVEAMKLDHHGAMTSALREVHRLVQPVLAPNITGMQSASGLRGFAAAAHCNRLVHGLFAGAELEGITATDAARQLLAELEASQ